jgi:hypothetical protein
MPIAPLSVSPNLVDGLYQDKMAEYVVTGDRLLQILTPIKDKISEYICKTCSAYKSQLKKVFVELESARAIIDILQREAPINTTKESTCDERITTQGWNIQKQLK